MPITVKTSVYEGPLDLLLELIEKRKLLINDISLAQVADDFLAYINGRPDMPVGETAEFISLAATLLLIKSRSLLPSLELSDEESQDIKQLEYRLALYQLIKEAAKELGGLNTPVLPEGAEPAQEPMFLPDASITPAALRAAVQSLIDGFPGTLTLPTVAVKKIRSLEETIIDLAGRISNAFRISFKDFTKGEKQDVIVGFLALLELVKQGIIKATQEEGGDIVMEADAVSTPRFGA
jgi:segregation and condensation protein A